jgi:hypothetical protein
MVPSAGTTVAMTTEADLEEIASLRVPRGTTPGDAVVEEDLEIVAQAVEETEEERMVTVVARVDTGTGEVTMIVMHHAEVVLAMETVEVVDTMAAHREDMIDLLEMEIRAVGEGVVHHLELLGVVAVLPLLPREGLV